MFVIEIEETQNNPRAGWDDYRPAYYAVAYQFDATSPLIRCPVYIWRHSYVLAEVEVVAQQLRDLYDAPGSQLDHFQVTRTGNRIFLMIHRKDGTQYAFLDAQAVTNTDLTTFAAKLRQFALVTSADEYTGTSPRKRRWYAVCGTYKRHAQDFIFDDEEATTL